MPHDLWLGAGLLLMGLLAHSTLVALLCVFALGSIFVVQGCARLRQDSTLLRRGLLWSAASVALSSIPKVVAAVQTAPLTFEELLPAKFVHWPGILRGRWRFGCRYQGIGRAV